MCKHLLLCREQLVKVDQLPYKYWSVIFMFINFTFLLYAGQIGSILCANCEANVQFMNIRLFYLASLQVQHKTAIIVMDLFHNQHWKVHLIISELYCYHFISFQSHCFYFICIIIMECDTASTVKLQKSGTYLFVLQIIAFRRNVLLISEKAKGERLWLMWNSESLIGIWWWFVKWHK